MGTYVPEDQYLCHLSQVLKGYKKTVDSSFKACVHMSVEKEG